MKRMIIHFFVSIIVVSIFRSVIRGFLYKESEERAVLKEQSVEDLGYVVVKEASSMRRLMGFCVIVSAIFPCVAYFDEGSTVMFYSLCGIPIFVAAFYATLCIWNIKVYLNEDYFIITTHFGKRYIIKYSEITSFKLASNRVTPTLDYVIRAKNKKFSVNDAAFNYEVFRNELIKHGVMEENTFDEIINVGKINVRSGWNANSGNGRIYTLNFPRKYAVLSCLIFVSSIAVMLISLRNVHASGSLVMFFSMVPVYATSFFCVLLFFSWGIAFPMYGDVFVCTFLGIEKNVRYEDIYCEYKGNYLKISQKYVDKVFYIYNKVDNFEVFINNLTERGILKDDANRDHN